MIHLVKKGETLAEISQNYRTSLATLIQANPMINPNLIYPGQPINIPNLQDPQTIPYKIDVSIGERLLRLYKDKVFIKSYPIAVGAMLSETPIGSFVIVNRAPNPGGPFGSMWLSLSKMHYGIHGTNDPTSIGKAVSKGCIRMFNHDVLELASLVPNGTEVFIHL
ncbi:L,D-transpeptidase family protein [Bacillus kexueae]|uniref:L,D-transpeptidase family protein n=1 Tax=Aeribacillus kexueae TaxID=2078952 RepID=UPI001FAF1409|nr:L,D-transpeptidase family protein [Bacillus kexueae]